MSPHRRAVPLRARRGAVDGREATRTFDAAVRRVDLRRQLVEALDLRGDSGRMPGKHASGGRSTFRLSVGLLGAVSEFPRWMLLFLAPEISGALGMARSGVSGAWFMATVVMAVAVMVTPWIVRRTGGRTTFAATGGVALSVLVGLVALAPSGATLVLAVVGVGAASAASVLHRPLVVDEAPLDHRAGALVAYRAWRLGGLVFAAVVVLCAVEFLPLTWRAALAASSVLALPLAALACRSVEPTPGERERRRVAEVDLDGLADVADSLFASATTGEVPRGAEAVRRLGLLPGFRRLLGAYAVGGGLSISAPVVLYGFLDERWGMSDEARLVLLAITGGVAAGVIAPAVTYMRRTELRGDSGRFASMAGWGLFAAGSLLGLAAVSPLFAPMVMLVAGAGACTVAGMAALDAAVFSSVRPEDRTHAAMLTELATLAGGSVLGAALLASLERRYGFVLALLATAVAGVVPLVSMRRSAALVRAGAEQTVDAVIDEADHLAARRRGTHVPVLMCANVDFSYGPMQVLFDVGFSVDEGEIVALLGTNGAGKSTLLRALSGLSFPQRGTVRLGGADVTHLAAELRVREGIVQVPGGKAIFGRLSVTDNLRAYGYTIGTDRQTSKLALGRVFDAFPVLADRREQLASTLSGGEQQMLALGKALMLDPRVLLVDELSLGLAPVVVEELLEIVRDFRARGTAVVLVEQSVNLALSIADRAYFMEKGEVRFEGRASDLLGRTDLLRSVFLEGAAAGLEGRSQP